MSPAQRVTTADALLQAWARLDAEARRLAEFRCPRHTRGQPA